MNLNSVFLFRCLVFSICALSLSACNQSANDSGSAGMNNTVSGPSGGSTVATISTSPTPDPTATASASPTPTASPTPVNTSSYPSCVSSDSTHICIGLKIVSYETNGVPILTEAQALTLVEGINTVWSQCNVGFQLEVFQSIDPTTVGLPYSPNWDTQTNAIRTEFADNTRFVVAAVGSESGSTIAVTMMPGSGIYGTIVDSAYAQNPLTVGHELGHYQGLYHVSDTTNLMNPYIGANTKTLTTSQCTTARSTDTSDWVAMLRTQ